jgi:hypothetical protein
LTIDHFDDTNLKSNLKLAIRIMTKIQRQSLIQLDPRFVADLVKDPDNLKRLNRDDKRVVLTYIQMNIGQMECLSSNDKDLLIVALLGDVLFLEAENEKSFAMIVHELGIYLHKILFLIFLPVIVIYRDLKRAFITDGSLDLADGLFRLSGYVVFSGLLVIILALFYGFLRLVLQAFGG